MKSLLLIFTLVSLTSYAQKTVVKGKLIDAPLNYLELSLTNQRATKIDTVYLNELGEWEYVLNTNDITYLSFFTGSDAFHLVVRPKSQIFVEANNSFFDESLHITGDDAKANHALNGLGLMQENAALVIMSEVYTIDSTTVIKDFMNQMNLMKSYIEYLKKEHPFLKIGLPGPDKINDLIEMYLLQYRSNYSAYQQSRNLVGRTISNLKIVDKNGNPVDLNMFSGKITLIDLWANWCSFCIGNFPKLKEIESTFLDSLNVISLGIDMSFPFEDWKHDEGKYAFENSFFVLNEDNDAYKALGIIGLPKYIILDEHMRVIDGEASTTDFDVLKQNLQSLIEKSK